MPPARTGDEPVIYQSLAANVNGVRVHYLKAGTGKRPLVLIHGFGDTSHMWVPLFDEFGKDSTSRGRARPSQAAS